MVVTLPLDILGYIRSSNSYLSGHLVLPVLLRYLHLFQWLNQWLNHTLNVSYSIPLFIGTFGDSTVI